MAEGTEKNNVLDFTAYRIERRADALYAEGKMTHARALYEALEAYLSGECEVQFIEGKTYISPRQDDNAEGLEK